MAEKKQTYAPGTLDHTRQNIGPIDIQEALEMQKKLGGEIIQERSEPVNTQNMPHRTTRRTVVKSSGMSSSDVSARSAAASTSMASPSRPSTSQIVNASSASKISDDDELPPMASKDLKQIENLMMDSEYNLKPNYGLLNFLYRMSSKNRKKLSRDFGEFYVKNYVDHLQAFITTIKTFIQISPDTYKAKIATDTELKFKFLRTVGKWTMQSIKVAALELEQKADNLTIAMTIPFVSAIYKELLTIYYIGEQKVPLLIKEIYADLTIYPKINKDKIQELAKQGITEWLYICDQVIKGLYPLLMRMCGTEYAEYPQFFTAQVGSILKFVGLTKFDLLVPEKKKPQKEEEKVEEEKKPDETRHIAGQKDEIVDAGLKILEQLFPDAGFSKLETHPDMFPYFQPLYKFGDGFNALSPKNGIQVALVLMRIIEDLFQGCRNIQFNLKADEVLSDIPDDISTILSDWSYYREDLFDKKYGDYLRQFVNATYTNKDYPNTQYGKESINNMLWRTKYYFFPNFKFNPPVLTKPLNDSKYKPVYARTDYIRTVFTTLSRRIDENIAAKKAVLGVLNPWDRYNFDIPNTISKRLDVLLGAKKMDDVTSATNANLIKYTLLIMAVLDWWLNNPASPAHTTDPMQIYRVSEKDGTPEFSAPERTDQNQLFADGIKKAIASRKA
ncbi:MAG: hypothetical protein IJ828_11225 [Treponema sp.]|nr:hypothetical protein [Treponema sp.]